MIAVAPFGLLFTWASKLAAFSIAGKTTDWLSLNLKHFQRLDLYSGHVASQN
jgi:hypothetical protein